VCVWERERERERGREGVMERESHLKLGGRNQFDHPSTHFECSS
jgi:hypothetical protein